LAVRLRESPLGAARLCDVGDVMKVIGESVRGAELAVASIAESGNNKGTFIQSFVD
jgi:hypothetical protein